MIKRRAPKHGPRIVLAVTTVQSLRLMAGFPEYLVEQGWDVHVVCAYPYDLGSGVTTHHIDMVRDPSPIKDFVSLVKWTKLLLAIRPDVISAGTPKAGLLGTLAARATMVPVRIYMLRGLRAGTERGLKRRILLASERLTAASASNVVAVSDSLKGEFAALKLAPISKITVIGKGSSNGVAIPSSFDEEVNDPELGSRAVATVGYVGRIHPHKGVDVLLAASQILIEQGLKLTVLLVGPEEPVGYLQKCMHFSRLSPASVKWTGSVENPESLYRRMDVLCLPSMREGFPNVVLEAAAQSVPAVASRVTGCVDAVVDHSTGRLFTPGNAVELAARLKEMLGNPERTSEMGRRARERVERDFAREKVWRLTLDHYTRQLSDRN